VIPPTTTSTGAFGKYDFKNASTWFEIDFVKCFFQKQLLLILHTHCQVSGGIFQPIHVDGLWPHVGLAALQLAV
jgi:hypothetical protein